MQLIEIVAKQALQMLDALFQLLCLGQIGELGQARIAEQLIGDFVALGRLTLARLPVDLLFQFFFDVLVDLSTEKCMLTLIIDFQRVQLAFQ